MTAEIHSKGSKLCDYVVRFNYPKDDYISALLINDYKAYILSYPNQSYYDFVINEYMNNSQFNKFIHDDAKELQYYITDTKFYLINKYEEYKSLYRDSKWI